MNALYKRLGRFALTYDLLYTGNPGVLEHLFSGKVVVRAEDKPEHRCIVYTAMSAAFDELEEGRQIPVYEAEIRRYDGSEAGWCGRTGRTGEERWLYEIGRWSKVPPPYGHPFT